MNFFKEKKHFKLAVLLFSILTLPLVFLLFNKPVKSAATHIVVSEIQIAGDATGDDFIELYNPTSEEVNLGNYRLVKVSSTGTADDGIVAFTSEDIISPHGFFLWCNNNIASTLGCDRNTSETISDNNSVGLRDGPLDTGILVDAVTFGTVTNPLGEGSPIDPAPEANQSVERKALSTSTAISMGPGGDDEFLGNGEDTNDNSSDFVTRVASEPQNTSSDPEPALVSPTPTESPSPSPTESPSPSPTESASPTASPTATPTESPTPSPTESATPTATPTQTPTPTPTESATPTASPTETPSPTPTETATASPVPTETPTMEPSPTPTEEPTPFPTPKPRFLGAFRFFRSTTVCFLQYRFRRVGFMKVFFPRLTCIRI